MLTGLIFILIGALILRYPRLLELFAASLCILFGLGMMAAAWQFRRMRKASASPFVNWIIRW